MYIPNTTSFNGFQNSHHPANCLPIKLPILSCSLQVPVQSSVLGVVYSSPVNFHHTSQEFISSLLIEKAIQDPLIYIHCCNVDPPCAQPPKPHVMFVSILYINATVHQLMISHPWVLQADMMLWPCNINSDLRTLVHPTPHSETQSWVPHWCNPALTRSRSSDPTLLPVISSLSYFLYEHCFTLPYLLFLVLPSVMPVHFRLTHIRFLGPLSNPSRLSLYVHNTFQTWIVLCSLFVQTLSYISRTTPVYFLSSNLDLSST